MATTPSPLSSYNLQVPPTPLHGPRFDRQPYERSPRRSKRVTIYNSPKVSSRIDGCTTPPPTLPRASVRQSPRLLSKVETTTTTTTSTRFFTGLPTPAKTPSKKKQILPAPAATARVLFPTGSSKKAGGFTLLGEDDTENISIFEDSNARIPEVVEGDDNPFLSTGPRRTKRRKTAAEPADEPSKNGMWYNFRGRKIYRAFEDGQGQDMPRPRLLFPSAEQVEEREEDDTDVASSPIPAHDDEDQYFAWPATLSEKDKVGKVTRSPQKASKPSAPATPMNGSSRKGKARLQTPEDNEGEDGVINPFNTPPPTARRKRARPANFGADSDEDEDTEATPRASNRPQSKLKKLRFDDSDDVIRPLGSAHKRAGRGFQGPLTPARALDDTPRKPRRI